jgi:hypothetical protein
MTVGPMYCVGVSGRPAAHLAKAAVLCKRSDFVANFRIPRKFCGEIR